MRTALGLLLLVQHAPAAEVGEPLPPVSARAVQLVAHIRREPSDLGAVVALGKLMLRTKHPDDAASLFGLALKKGSTEPRLAVWLAIAHRDTGRAAKAVAVLEEYLGSSPGDQVADRLLKSLRGVDCPTVDVSELSVFADIARHEACYDAQHRATVALARYNLQKGANVRLVHYNWTGIVEDLHTHGYADGPILEPSGKGMLLSAEDGRVHCTEHGAAAAACAEGERPPRLERVRVAPEVLLDAARSRDPVLLLSAARALADSDGPSRSGVVAGLVHGLENEAPEMKGYHIAIRRTLAGFAGKDLGADASTWRRWADEAFGER